MSSSSLHLPLNTSVYRRLYQGLLFFLITLSQFISASPAHAVNEVVMAWGKNIDGQLGDGTATTIPPYGKTTPVQGNGLTGVMAISGGGSHSLALKSDGTVWAWGSDWFGQLGDGLQTVSRFTQEQVNGLTGVVAISAGGAHSLALKSDGTVWSWGCGWNGQLGINSTEHQARPVQVSDLNGVIAISAGGTHSLALKSDGTVWAWGDNYYGKLGEGLHIVNRTTPGQVSGLTGVVAISAGAGHSLALKSNGTLWSWGINDVGQLGDGTTAPYNISPVQVVGLTNIISMTGGGSHSLALKSDGTVWAWGYNSNKQLGIETLPPPLYYYRNTPAQVIGLTGVVAIAAASLHSLALKSDGTVWAWGDNYNGQLGDGTTTDHSNPVQVNGLTGAIGISARGYHSLAIVAGATSSPGTISINNGAAHTNSTSVNLTLSCTNASGCAQMQFSNDGTTWSAWEAYAANSSWTLATGEGEKTVYVKFRDGAGNISAPMNDAITLAIPPTGSVSINNGDFSTGAIAVTLSLSCSDASGCAQMQFSNDGGAWSAWEAYAASKAWVLTLRSGAKAVYVKFKDGLGNVSTIANDLILFVNTNNGTTAGWGNNWAGQIGDGTTANRYSSVLVGGLTGVVSLAGGANHSLALKSDGTVWAWGDNYYGQLGDGTIERKNTPIQVSGLAGVVSLSGGYNHSIALRSDGTVWTWGDNSYGQLGVGLTIPYTYDSSTPVQVSGLSGIVAVSAGADHCLALKADGTVWAWGVNSYGQLGDGTTSYGFAPVQVKNLSNIVSVAGGVLHSIALKSDGTVWTWGDNYNGQLGVGLMPPNLYFSSTPIQVGGLTGVVSVSGGSNHSLALKSDGTVLAWGSNTVGQLGDGTNVTRATPVPMSGFAGVASVSGGSSHSLALKSDGTVWAWGWNYYGQLGDGTNIQRNTPVQVIGFTGAVAVSTGYYHSLAIFNDVTSPAGSILINSGASNTNATTVNLALACTDASGCSQMQFSNDNLTWSAWEAYSSIKVWTLSYDTGTKTVYVKFKDFTGNTSAAFSDTIVIETTSPTGTISINSGAASTKSTSAILSLSCTDASGCAEMRFSNDNSTWSTWGPYAASTSWTLTAGDGTKTVYAQFKDNAGNISATSSDTILLAGTVTPGLAATIACPSAVTAGSPLNATIYLSNFNTESAITVNRLSALLFGNANQTILGAGIWGPYNKSISSKIVMAGESVPPFYVTIIDAIPASLKGTVAEVSVEAITSTGLSYDGGACSVLVQ